MYVCISVCVLRLREATTGNTSAFEGELKSGKYFGAFNVSAKFRERGHNLKRKFIFGEKFRASGTMVQRLFSKAIFRPQETKFFHSNLPS